jgi:hypothetical protein
MMREGNNAHLCDGQLGDLKMNYHYLSLLLCVLPNMEVKDDCGASEKMNEKMRVGLGVVDLFSGVIFNLLCHARLAVIRADL